MRIIKKVVLGLAVASLLQSCLLSSFYGPNPGAWGASNDKIEKDIDSNPSEQDLYAEINDSTIINEI